MKKNTQLCKGKNANLAKVSWLWRGQTRLISVVVDFTASSLQRSCHLYCVLSFTFRPLPCLLIFSGWLLVRGCKWCSSRRKIPEEEMGQFSWKNISTESHAMYDGFLYKIQCDLIIIYWFNPVYSQKLPYKIACEGEIYRGSFMS